MLEPSSRKRIGAEPTLNARSKKGAALREKKQEAGARGGAELTQEKARAERSIERDKGKEEGI